MPESRFFGVRCKCGQIIEALHATQPEPVELEEVKRKLRLEESPMKLVVHAPVPPGCGASNRCNPDDLLLWPSVTATMGEDLP